MSITTIDKLKSYFKTGAKPTQEQFHAVLDSYIHKGEDTAYILKGLEGATFMGVATPDSVPPVPTQKVFYIANEVGAYPNYGGLAVADGEIAFFTYNGSWGKVALEDVASRSMLVDTKKKYAVPAYFSIVESASLNGDLVVVENAAISLDGGTRGDYIDNANNWHVGIYKLRSNDTLFVSGNIMPKHICYFTDMPFMSENYISYNTSGSIPYGARYVVMNFSSQDNIDDIRKVKIIQKANTFAVHEELLRDYQYEPLIPYDRKIGYAVNNIGEEVVMTDYWSIAYYDISSIQLDKIRLAGCFYNQAYKQIAFYDINDNFIGNDIYFNSIEGSARTDDFIISIPPNTAKIKYTTIGNVTLYRNVVSNYISNSSIKDTIESYEKNQKEYSEINIPLVINQGHINNIGETSTSAAFLHTFINIQELNIRDNEELLFSAGIGGNTGLAFISYFDENDTYIGAEYYHNKPTLITSAKINIYDNVAKIGINSSHSYPIELIKRSYSDETKVDVLAKTIVTDIRNIKEVISEYSKKEVIEDYEKLEGTFFGKNGNLKSNGNFYVKKYDIADIIYDKLFFSTRIYANSQMPLIGYYDENMNIIKTDYYYDGPIAFSSEEVLPPANTKYVLVNAPNSIVSKLEKSVRVGYYDFDDMKEKVDTLTTESNLMKVVLNSIDSADFIVRTSYNATKDIILQYYTNGNGLTSPYACWVGDKKLSDSEIMTDTYIISQHSDSTAPLFQSAVYWHLFAQHGYVIPMVANTVGMTIEDVGAKWVDQEDREYTIGDVNGSYIYLLPTMYKDSNGNDTRGWKTPYDTILTLQHVSGGAVTTPFNVTLRTTTQLSPIMTHSDRKYMIDGRVIDKAGTYYCDDFSVSESQVGYDPASIDVWFPTPVLDNANEMARFTWSYNFKGANCAVNTTIDIRTRVECQSYGATQQQTFFDKYDYKAMFLIPKAQKRGDVELDRPFNSPDGNAPVYSFYRNTASLKDVNKPIDRLIGFLHNPNDNTYLCGMASGLSLVSGDTVEEKRIAHMPIGNKDGHWRIGSISPSNTNKFYIAAVNTAEFEDDNYHFPTSYFKEINYYVSYFDPAENVGQVYWYKDGNNYVIYIHTQDSYIKQAINLHKIMEGLKCEIVEQTEGISLLTDTVSNGKVFITSNNASNYLVLKTL